ncbi:ATPase, P-type (transporting), HAD superfamily, subfamily IC [Butyrivibrio sp. ob235]|uniref:ATP-binding protein n=1 Tax=Butyrivibrio sp. ob235 TaxID=1761780 RepID=UPI0008CDEE76|nr:AAA family ATPase [Butyrivibrio sp. ob235]SEM22564.1 ATPase, P-type (transporting), HAD superfamily, subfamily IC [Butyrivibrio sp. ob235]
MRIGLYGLPSAGKSFILDEVKNFEVFAGSKKLFEIAPDFHSLSADKQTEVRQQLARELKEKDRIIVDGHYAFGESIVFTEEDGQLYDAFVYLYVDPEILKNRMLDSVKNQRYAEYDIASWQNKEIEGLRKYCHENNKDFYIIDNPEKGYFADISLVLEFINSLACGFSCVKFAHKCAETILEKTAEENTITLLDGDKTLTLDDSSGKLGYRTHIFDNNFYTGFQSWRHHIEFSDFLQLNDIHIDCVEDLGMRFNENVICRIEGQGYILTSGFIGIWERLAKKLELPLFYGNQMAAESKYFITKELQEAGKMVIAIGDGMNDYYMLKQANHGYLVAKSDGTLSRSLKGRDVEGMEIVRA